MPANYDSTLPGALFRRFDSIDIKYPSPMTPSIRANETEAVVEIGGGITKKRDTRKVSVDMTKESFEGVVQLHDNETGADLPGLPAPWIALLQQGKAPKALGFMLVSAMLREEQKRLDALEDNPPE